MANSRHLWLLGLSGSGKSTVGPRLAQALRLPWIDTDAEIARDSGKSIPEIFTEEGEEGFRKKESAVLAKVALGPTSVISCGGGVVLREVNRQTMASTGLRIYLQAEPADLARRLRSPKNRPLLSGKSPEATLAAQLAVRAPGYEECDIQIAVARLNPDEVVAAIRQKLPEPWSR
jgi:shikimate kinase